MLCVPVLNSLKTKQSKLKLEKNWPGRAWIEILIFPSGRAQNSFLYFWPGQAEIVAMRAGPGPEKFGLCRPLHDVTFLFNDKILYIDVTKIYGIPKIHGALHQ